MPRALALCLLLPLACAAPRAALPVFDRGPLTNLGFGSASDAANTNASLHALWSLGLSAAGYALYGRQGLRWVCGVWSAQSLAQEAFLHAPPGPLGPDYSAEVRTDLASKILPCAALVVADALR